MKKLARELEQDIRDEVEEVYRIEEEIKIDRNLTGYTG
jgi:hypothetical protein